MLTVRRGFSRTVLLVGGLAVKLPRVRTWRQLLCGLLSNLSEAERRGAAGACPVVLALPLGLLVVQRRVDPLPPEYPLSGVPPHVRELAGYDDKPCSYGRLPDGEVVAVDFHGAVAA